MRIITYALEGLRIAIKALHQYKMRSILTTLGIIIGVTTVIAIVSLIQGLNRAFSNEISAMGSDTLYISKLPWFMNADTYFTYRNRKDLNMSHFRMVEQHATLIKAAAPTITTRRNVKYKDKKLERCDVVGTNEDYLVTSNAIPAVGRFLSSVDVNNRRWVCVIGSEVAEKLFENENPVGRRINIGGQVFRVIGVLEAKGDFLGFNMDTNIAIPIGVFQKAFGARRRSLTIEVKVADPSMVDEAENELIGVMRRARKLSPTDKNDFAINRQSMFLDIYNNLTRILWAVAIGVGSISLLVGGIGIMNILLVSVTERTREIGIRKAMGAKHADIMWQFLVESVVICTIGVVIGIFAAIGIAKIVSATSPIPSVISAWVIYLGLGFVFGIGLFFGIYPAMKAARLNPIEALRYE